MAKVLLRKGKDLRIRRGHPWIYRGEIDAVEGPVVPGEVVEVYNAARFFLGRGYINPMSQITVRMLTRTDEAVDIDFFRRRLEQAGERRRRFFPDEAAIRLVFGEGDFLPGLVVDRFDDALVVQFLTLGMESRKEWIVQLLDEIWKPSGIYERSDVASRKLEGLSPSVGFLKGRFETARHIVENNLRFSVDIERGQKTGYFLDHKKNRKALAPLMANAGDGRGAKVLDAFCYTGTFSVHAAAYGARRVVGLDISGEAVETAQRNAALNGVQDRCEFRVGNAFDELRAFDDVDERFDCVVLDPPAFAKGKSAVEGARRGYKEINLRGMRLLRTGGFLVTCSCSYHMGAELFWETVLEAARDAKRTLRLVDNRTQSRDHPILPDVPETHYLKCLIFEVF